ISVPVTQSLVRPLPGPDPTGFRPAVLYHADADARPDCVLRWIFSAASTGGPPIDATIASG
ncbi:MAG: hypothetical protein ABMA13_23990, partial [Chthoniobacteraceae bacterium]